MNYSKCNTELPDGLKFCSECGESINNKNVCPECNTENKPLVRFCSECGYSFNSLSDKKQANKSIQTLNKCYNTYKKSGKVSPATGTGALLNLLFIPGTGYFIAGYPSKGFLILLTYIIVQAVNALLCLVLIGFVTLPACEILFRVITLFDVISTDEQ